MADYFLSDLVEATALVNTDLFHLRTIGNVDKKIQFLNFVKTFRDILNKNANYTIVDTDRNPIILVDSTSGDVTITLPTLAANQNKMVWIVKLVAANNVIVDGEGGETINGIPNVTLSNAYEFIKLIGTSPTWLIDGILEIRTVDIKDQNVTTIKIKDRNVTRIKTAQDAIGDYELDLGIGANQIDGDVTPLGTAITSSPTGGTATNLANNTFLRAAIQVAFNRLINLSGVSNGSALARHLATDSVETAKIKALNVTGPKLATDAVETLKVKARNITLAKMVAGTLDTYFKAQGAGVDPIYEKLALIDTGIKIDQGAKTGAGEQAISNIPFQPSVVIFIATQQTGDHVESSWGFDDGTRHYVIYSSSSGNKYPSISFAIHIESSAGNYHTAKITSLASNGFTLTWYQVGIEASTGFIYLALP